MRNSKKLLCMLLSLIMVFSVFTVAAVPAGAYNTDGVIYFDAASAGWSGASWISFYIYDLSNYESVTVWGSKNKSFTTHGGDIWAFNAKEAGVLLGHEYGIIFENLDTSAQTADLLFNYSCFGDTAYVPDPDDMIENAVDSNKKSMKAAWKNSSLGCIKRITSLGNIVGESIPDTTSAYQMMVNFLASKGPQSLMNALNWNGKDAQTTIDDIAKELGLSKDGVEKAIYEAAEIGTNDGSGDKTDWSSEWDASKSNLAEGSGSSTPDSSNSGSASSEGSNSGSSSSDGPGSTPDSGVYRGTWGEIEYVPSDIPTGNSNRLNFYVPTSEWHDFEKIGFYIYEIGGEEFIPWGSKRMFNSEETSPGVWSFDLGNAGIVLEDSKAYGIIFVNKETMAQTAPLLLDTSCIGDTAYCTGRYMENVVDSNKFSLETRWKNSSLGPMKCITSIGNVVGETIPANTTAYNMFVDFLKYTLSNARWYSGKNDQSIIDDVAGALELTDTDIEKAIKEAGVTVDWKAPIKEDIHGYILKNYYLTGSINGDNSGLTDVHKELRFTDSGSGDMVLSGVKLKEGDKVKAALYNGGKAFTLYPDGVGREVVIDKSGVYDFYFKPYEMGNPNYWYITPSYVGEAEPGVTVRGSIKSYIDDSDVTVKLTGTDNNYTAETKGKSDYSVTDVPAGEYTLTVSKANHVTREYTVTVADTDVTKDVEICPLGDVTGDGKTNVQDCTAILRYVRKLDMDLSDYQLKCADVTGDNKVNVQDVTKILRHVRKIEALY